MEGKEDLQQIVHTREFFGSGFEKKSSSSIVEADGREMESVLVSLTVMSERKQEPMNSKKVQIIYLLALLISCLLPSVYRAPAALQTRIAADMSVS